MIEQEEFDIHIKEEKEQVQNQQQYPLSNEIACQIHDKQYQFICLQSNCTQCEGSSTRFLCSDCINLHNQNLQQNSTIQQQKSSSIQSIYQILYGDIYSLDSWPSSNVIENSNKIKKNYQSLTKIIENQKQKIKYKTIEIKDKLLFQINEKLDEIFNKLQHKFEKLIVHEVKFYQEKKILFEDIFKVNDIGKELLQFLQHQIQKEQCEEKINKILKQQSSWKETNFIETGPKYFEIDLEEIKSNYQHLQSYSDEYYQSISQQILDFLDDEKSVNQQQQKTIKQQKNHLKLDIKEDLLPLNNTSEVSQQSSSASYQEKIKKEYINNTKNQNSNNNNQNSYMNYTQSYQTPNPQQYFQQQNQYQQQFRSQPQHQQQFYYNPNTYAFGQATSHQHPTLQQHQFPPNNLFSTAIAAQLSKSQQPLTGLINQNINQNLIQNQSQNNNVVAQESNPQKQSLTQRIMQKMDTQNHQFQSSHELINLNNNIGNAKAISSSNNNTTNTGNTTKMINYHNDTLNLDNENDEYIRQQLQQQIEIEKSLDKYEDIEGGEEGGDGIEGEDDSNDQNDDDDDEDDLIDASSIQIVDINNPQQNLKKSTKVKLKKKRKSKQILKVNKCGHTDREYYAKQQCYPCYRKSRYENLQKKPWKCAHDKLYALGLCMACYQKKYTENKKRIKQTYNN